MQNCVFTNPKYNGYLFDEIAIGTDYSETLNACMNLSVSETFSSNYPYTVFNSAVIVDCPALVAQQFNGYSF